MLRTIFVEFMIGLPSAIVRIFRIEIDPAMRDEFERGFCTVSVDAVLSSDGAIACKIGWPTKWSPNTYVMISKWRDEAALVAFAGTDWNQPMIPPSMARFAQNCSVEHYAIAEQSTN